MLITLVALFAASPLTAVDTERAFSAESRKVGQWTASRKYAHPDAVMFTPQAIWARDFLKNRKDPAQPSTWSPDASYVSCDGLMAVNTGNWRSANGRQGGFFTTVWEQANGRWQWISDGRHTLRRPPAPRKAPLVRTGSCEGRAPGAPLMAPPPTTPAPGRVTIDDFGRGQSGDRTLGWYWRVGPRGVRQFRAYLWTGHGYSKVLDQKIGGK